MTAKLGARSEVAERTIVASRPIAPLWGRPMLVGEETGKSTSPGHRSTSPSMQGKTRRDNVGKDHLPAGTGDNLQRPTARGTTEGGGRVMVWRMSPFERRRRGNAL